jgi:hypothetical protein
MHPQKDLQIKACDQKEEASSNPKRVPPLKSKFQVEKNKNSSVKNQTQKIL